MSLTVQNYSKIGININPLVSKSIYVAGSWEQRNQLYKKMNELRDLGFIVTSDWPKFETRSNNPTDYAKCSELDIMGVMSADTILAFMTDPKYPYRGTFTEIGCAIGSAKRIIVICDGVVNQKSAVLSDDCNLGDVVFSHYCMENVFFWDTRIEHVSSFDDAIKLLNGEKIASPYISWY